MATGEGSPEPKRVCQRQASISSYFSSCASRVQDSNSPSAAGLQECDSDDDNNQESPNVNVYADPNDPALYLTKRNILSDDDRLALLTSKSSFPTNFVFPATSGRRFNPSWSLTRPWLRYSITNDKAYCSYCLCFPSVDCTESPFISSGFNKWKKALGKKHSLIDKHQESEAHKLADEKVCLFLNTRQPGTDIGSKMTKEVAIQQIRTKKGILSIIDVIIALGKRGIAFRGNWNKSTKTEDGNFSFFVDWKSQFDKDLKEHFEHAAANTKYTSPIIQNEIISLCDSAIRENILLLITSYWSLMVDETQDCSTMEQVSVCARFLNNEYEVCEEFLGFIRLEKMDAQHIADLLLSTLQHWELDLSFLIGQGYDGAAVMSSGKNGVQAKIAEKFPFATYIHCRSHVLNLAISASCTSIPSIRNLFDNVQKLTWFLSGSAKRKEIFLEIASSRPGSQVESLEYLLLDEESDYILDESTEQLEAGFRRHHVPKFCATRWSARVNTLSALIAKYSTVLETMDKISEKSTGESRIDAASYVRLLEDSQFIVALVVAQTILSYLSSVTLALQAKDCDLGEAYIDIMAAKKCIEDARKDLIWEKVWNRIELLAASINLGISKPRIAAYQRHRANAGQVDQTTSDYYRINVYYCFIDHVIEELSTRFSNEHEQIIAASYLVPKHLSKLTTEKIDHIHSFYGKFLSLEEKASLPTELAKWRVIYDSALVKKRPATARDTLCECSHQTFPAIHKILTIFLTIPVGSVSCERSFSALRCLKLWTRSSMTEDRLSGLAMLLVHRDSHYIPSPTDIYQKKANWRHLVKTH